MTFAPPRRTLPRHHHPADRLSFRSRPQSRTHPSRDRVAHLPVPRRRRPRRSGRRQRRHALPAVHPHLVRAGRGGRTRRDRVGDPPRRQGGRILHQMASRRSAGHPRPCNGPAGSERHGPRLLHERRRQQSRLCAVYQGGDRAGVASRSPSPGRRPGGSSASARRPAHALPHARADGHSDHGRQGDGRLRRTAVAADPPRPSRDNYAS